VYCEEWLTHHIPGVNKKADATGAKPLWHVLSTVQFSSVRFRSNSNVLICGKAGESWGKSVTPLAAFNQLTMGGTVEGQALGGPGPSGRTQGGIATSQRSPLRDEAQSAKENREILVNNAINYAF